MPDLDYVGFVEGDDIGQGKVDVVVTEGFAGNIALKTAEGTARQIGAISARRDEPLARRAHRLSVRAFGVRAIARADGSAALEWRRFSRPQRHRHQEPWRNRRRGFCRRHRAGLWRGARGTSGQDHGGARTAGPRAATGAWAERPCDGSPLRHARLRQLSAEPNPHQRRSGAQGRHVRRMDRAAHRHSRAPHRRARRTHLADGDPCGARGARACAC